MQTLLYGTIAVQVHGIASPGRNGRVAAVNASRAVRETSTWIFGRGCRAAASPARPSTLTRVVPSTISVDFRTTCIGISSEGCRPYAGTLPRPASKDPHHSGAPESSRGSPPFPLDKGLALSENRKYLTGAGLSGPDRRRLRSDKSRLARFRNRFRLRRAAYISTGFL